MRALPSWLFMCRAGLTRTNATSRFADSNFLAACACRSPHHDRTLTCLRGAKPARRCTVGRRQLSRTTASLTFPGTEQCRSGLTQSRSPGSCAVHGDAYRRGEASPLLAYSPAVAAGSASSAKAGVAGRGGVAQPLAPRPAQGRFTPVPPRSRWQPFRGSRRGRGLRGRPGRWCPRGRQRTEHLRPQSLEHIARAAE